MSKLKISNEVGLPIEAVTQTFGILAIKGSGKSYTASVMAEEMLKAGQQIIILDPTGAWWGLQSSADGKSPGFPVVVFGGDHGNVPLDEHSAEIIAHAIVEQKFCAILDFSLLRKGQTNRFAAIFLETLYRINREAIHLFVDEADVFAPQKPFADQARTLGSMEDIVRRGRKRGIGCTMITQRPAVINKDVLTQCEILIALRVNHPKDINAIMEWVKVNASIEQAKAMLDSLPSMPTGQAWIWSPSWLNIFKRISIRKRETFDSGATPKPGERIVAPKKLAEIDIKVLGDKIGQTIEKKKAEDPALLKKRIVELEKQIQTAKPIEQKSSEEDKKQINELGKTITDQYHAIKNLTERNSQYFNFIKSVQDSFETFITKQSSRPLVTLPVPPSVVKPTTKTIELKKYVTQSGSIEQGSSALGRCEKSILSVLAQRSGINSSRSQIGILSGYSASSGSFNNSISKLRTLGYLSGNSDQLMITQEGIKNVGTYEKLPEGEALHQYWINKLPKCEGVVLNCLIQNYPNSMSKIILGESTNYSDGSGSFNNALSKLRTLELITGSADLRASDNLF